MTLFANQSEASTPETTVEPNFRCERCHQTKPISDFFRDAARPSGHSHLCKPCDRAYAAVLRVKVNETRSFGIEIECYCPSGITRERIAARLRRAGVDAYAEHYNHSTRSYWKVVTDATVGGYPNFTKTINGRLYNGMEIVSPPLTGKAGIAELKKVCRVLKSANARVDKACGLHVHHGAPDFESRNFKSLVKLYVKHEAALDAVVPPSRRGRVGADGMAHSLLDPGYLCGVDYYDTVTVEQVMAKVDGCYNYSGIGHLWRDRYVKLEVGHAFYRHGTVEFRHFGGTVEFAKMVNWVALTQSMVDAAANGLTVTATGPSDLPALFKTVKAQPTVRKWFAERAAALAAA